MLQDIRDNAQGTIAKVIIGLLIISLSIWGMDAIIGGFSGEPEVATVNGNEITEREFLRTVQLETQQRLMQMENPDQSLLDEDQIRQEVLEALIQEAVLAQDAINQGLELSDADVDALLTQMPQFQVDGQFSRDRFVAAVRNLGMGVAEFRESLRKNYVVSQIRATIAQTGLAVPAQADQLLAIQNQTRDFRVLKVDARDIADQVAVSDEEIERYYEANKAQFQEPEQVTAAYITLALDTLAEAVEVSEDDVQAYYQDRADDFAREERRASHILIEPGAGAEETIAQIRQRLDDGESFADLAEEFSIDTVSAREGGDLGFAGRDVYDQAFEEALFAMDEGEVSGPVETSFGVHLIRLEEIRRSDVPALAEVEAELRDELSRARATERFAEVRAQLADAAYAADDLAGPAEELGLQVQEVSGVTREGGPGPFGHAGLVRQLFSDDVLEGGYNTELIDIENNVAVVARVREHQEPRQRELTEVEADIQEVLKQQTLRKMLNDKVEDLLARVEAGEQPDAGEWQSFNAQGRNVPGLEPYIAQVVFALPHPEEGEPVVGKALGNGSAAVIVLDAVQPGEASEEDAEFDQIQQFMAQFQGQREYQAYQQYLRNTAEIKRN
ncbi:MAG TPA: SurA N-terminal domain-containing protein [Marinobacter sp.]|nr:SurA N-terminal domain-containing protein [Marinobacter sp.]